MKRKIEGTEGWGLRREQPLDDLNEIWRRWNERESTMWHFVEKSLCKWLWIFRKIDYVLMTIIRVMWRNYTADVRQNIFLRSSHF